MADTSGNLIPREYSNFRGVDLRGGEVTLSRSPDSLNMWKDYRKDEGISTRPEIELHEAYDNIIFGIFFYRVGNTEMMLVHSGTTLFKVVNGTRTQLYTGLNPRRSQAFIYNNIFYFKDGINYLQYNGETIGEVTGFIPTTSIGRKPNGGGTVYQDVNMLTGIRINTFVGDGESTEYYLDAQNIDSDFTPIVTVNDEVTTAFTVDTTKGMIKFEVAPTEPLTVGRDNVSIKYRRTVAGYRERINKCTLLQVFDNRVFFSGNQDYPNTVWHCSLNDPSYCSDLDYYNEGLDLSPVRSMVAGNNALWVFKEPSQANTTVFYHNPVVDADYGKVYPSVHSSISTGCIATGINFNDDIAFFSERGMEAINGDVTTEQVVAHRSSFVDTKLLNEANYKNMILEEWEGYLLVIIDNKVYLADSRKMATFENHNEYEWWYWELSKNITCTKVHNGTLYLGTNEGIYKFGYEADDYTEVTFTEEDGQYVLYGESTQETRSGKNLFDCSIYNGSNENGLNVVINPDGSLTITGTPTDDYLKLLGDKVDVTDLLEDGISYTISQSSPAYIYAQVEGEPLSTEDATQFYYSGNTPTRTSWVFTVDKTKYKYLIYLQTGLASDVGEDIDITLFFQLEKGSIATEFEKFGSMPSPDFPSEIINTYKAGKYKTTINGTQYRFTLDDDLRSAGEVKDKIYLNKGKLYLDKKINEGVLNGGEDWFLSSLETYQVFGLHYEGIKQGSKFTSNYFMNQLKTIHLEEKIGISNNNAENRIYISNGSTTLEEFKTWLSTNNVTVYYELMTSTTTEIDYLVSPSSYWTTPFDDFKYRQYQKTTNKRGCVVDMIGESVTIAVKTDNNEFEDIDTYTNTKGYIVSRIKRKKWKEIQIKFSSNKPFSLYSATLESYIGGYVKR